MQRVGNAPQTLHVSNGAACGTLHYTITPQDSRVGVSPTSGSSTGEGDEIAVAYGIAGLSPGVYTSSIAVELTVLDDLTVVSADSSEVVMNSGATIPITLPDGLLDYWYKGPNCPQAN